MAFFIVQMFQEMKKKLLRNVIFSATLFYGCGLGMLISLDYIRLPLKVDVPILSSGIIGKKVLVLDDSNDEYFQNIPSTKYLDWDLRKEILQKPNDYGHLTDIFESLSKEMPEVIFDPMNHLSKILFRLPELEKKYRFDESKKAYFLINK